MLPIKGIIIITVIHIYPLQTKGESLVPSMDEASEFMVDIRPNTAKIEQKRFFIDKVYIFYKNYHFTGE